MERLLLSRESIEAKARCFPRAWMTMWRTPTRCGRVVDVFVDELDLGQLGFDGVVPAEKVGQPTILPIS